MGRASKKNDEKGRLSSRRKTEAVLRLLRSDERPSREDARAASAPTADRVQAGGCVGLAVRVAAHWGREHQRYPKTKDAVLVST